MFPEKLPFLETHGHHLTDVKSLENNHSVFGIHYIEIST